MNWAVIKDFKVAIRILPITVIRFNCNYLSYL